jgi:hypothetical protein
MGILWDLYQKSIQNNIDSCIEKKYLRTDTRQMSSINTIKIIAENESSSKENMKLYIEQ